MKKFSMGMMLSSLLLIQVGCGEEAPPAVTPDPSAMMSHAPDAAAHGAGGMADAAADKAGAAVDAAPDKSGAAVDAAADKAGAAVDGPKEAVKDAAP